MPRLDRHHLDILRAVSEAGTLTAAASRLHLTQSALSHTIRKLEDQLGVMIWQREGRALHWTQAGHYLLGMAQRLGPQFEEAEDRLRQFARGERGTLRVGMECHPCYQWLLKIVAPYLQAWPLVDVDVKQKFQFGGIGALFGHEIDLLVTPDPLFKPGLRFEAVFDYEQILVTNLEHPLAKMAWIEPEQLSDQVLITYPVAQERLDIYTQFLMPAGIAPKRHKTIETTDILLQMVASGRGVAALPRWLVGEYATQLPITCTQLGETGIAKHIYLGIREEDHAIDYLADFIVRAKNRQMTA